MRVKRIVILLVTIIGFLTINSYAAGSISISASSSTVNVGEKVTLSISGNNAYGKVNISATNATLSASSVFLQNDTKQVTLTATGSGKISVNVTPSAEGVGDIDENPIENGASITITAVNKQADSTPPETPNQTPETKPQEKSSNANLNNLGINPNDFKGFKPGTTKYNVTVENNVESVEVYAKAQDSKAKVSGTGIKKLNEGNNALNVVVTAEDGTKKTYTINVTRKTAEESKEAEEENNKEEEKQENKLGLSELNIEGVELSPSFSLNTYEYVAKYIGEETKLNITTKASDDNAKVEIVGNEELKEGENLINILVTDSKGENTVTYQITLNKSLVDKEAIAKSQAQEQKQKNEKAIFIGVSAIIILIIIIILLIIKVRKNKNSDQYSINYSDYDDENYDNYQVENEEEQYNNQILERESSKKKSKGKRFK